MGCNCAAGEKIKRLHELYGEKITPNTETTLLFKIDKAINTLLVWFCIIVLSPILFGYVIYKTIFAKDNRISIRKLFKLSKNMENINYN